MLPTPSVEQQEIILSLCKNKNVIVNSVAGSGKTTTILHIAKKLEEKRILLLTYNKKLKLETREKIKFNNLSNIEAHSYHSFCVKYIDPAAHTDQGILQIIKKNKEPHRYFVYDVIILDEAQDINPTYYELVCRINKENPVKAQICLLGDVMQSIYDFNKADSRYLSIADQLLNFNDHEWVRHNLSTSFRVTTQIANFINGCMSVPMNINAIKNGNPVRYLVCHSFDSYGIFKEFLYYIRQGYKYEDFFILSPSLRSDKLPVRVFANFMSDKKKIPIYVPVSDDERIDTDIINGKVVFSTFHQVKGLERKVIIVFGFDETYFKYFKKDSNPNVCPNELYVAVSRGLECVTVIHNSSNKMVPFLNVENLANLSELCGDGVSKLKLFKKSLKKNNTDKNYQYTVIGVTDLLRHLPSSVINEASSYLDVKTVQEPEKMIKIETKTKQQNFYENVSEITGVAIPMYFEFQKNGVINIIKKFFTMPKDKIDLESLLYLANKYCSLKSGYSFKMNQITEYNWMTDEQLEMCYDRLKNIVNDEPIFEHKVSLINKTYNKEIVGFIDCIDSNSNTLWEFKCTNTLDDEHALQLALYAYLYQKQIRRYVKFELEEKFDKESVKTFEEGHQITFLNKNLEEEEGVITKVFKNGKFRVKNTKNKFMFIEPNNILKNISKLNEFEQQLINKYSNIKYKLFNILTNEIREITCSFEDLEAVYNCIIDNKYSTNKKCSDKDFIDMNMKIKNKYMSDNIFVEIPEQLEEDIDNSDFMFLD